MRKHLRSLTALACIAVLSAAVAAFAAPRTYVAHMTGSNEVPPVETKGQGQTVFQLNADGTELSFRQTVANLENVRFSHIHAAPAGQNGPIVVTLYPGPTTSGRTQGVLVEGTITSSDLEGSLSGMALSDLVALIEAGNAYVNVHTDAQPSGEIRGQIAAN